MMTFFPTTTYNKMSLSKDFLSNANLTATEICTVNLIPSSDEGRHFLVAMDLSENGWNAVLFTLQVDT